MSPTVSTEPTDQMTVVRASYFHWSAIIAGALAAASFSLVLNAFAAGVGIATSSTAPTWRDSSMALVLLSGVYLLLVALAASGVGGYVAGRFCHRSTVGTLEDLEMHDGLQGLTAWAIATLLTGLVFLFAIQQLSHLGAQTTRGAAGASVASENLIAYDLDRLFRGARETNQADVDYSRAEAGRILLTAPSHRGILAEDKAYLVRLVAARTGVSAGDAQRRVDETIARATDNIKRARRTAVILAFMGGAAALLGALVAWLAAVTGGQHRDGTAAPAWLRASSLRVATLP